MYDTTIYFILENFQAINREQEINREKLNIWFQLNKLTLNVEQTKCMLFHKRRAVPPINMSMNNIPIDIVPHFNQDWQNVGIYEYTPRRWHLSVFTSVYWYLPAFTGIYRRLTDIAGFLLLFLVLAQN